MYAGRDGDGEGDEGRKEGGAMRASNHGWAIEGQKDLDNFRDAALRPPSLMQGRGSNVLKQVGIYRPTRNVCR